MVRKMTLAGVLALLPVAACSSDIDDAEIEAKAEQAEKAASDAQDDIDAALVNAEYGPVIGEALSVSSLLSSEGAPIELTDLIGESGGVVVFSRSAAWCPYCQKQMVELKDAQAELSSMGIKLTVITYDPVKTLSQFAAEHGIGYQLVSDTESSTIIANNLLNEGVEEGTRFYGIPHPAVVVLSDIGDVQNMHVDTDYKVRPSNADVIAMAADVSGG